MRAIAPRTGAPEHTFAEEQEEYQPITVALYNYEKSRGLLTRWTLNDAERKAIAAGEDIYIMQLNFGEPMTPITVRCGPGEFECGTGSPT